MNFVDVVSLAGLIALGMKVVSFLKFVTNRDVNSAVTQLAVWAAGVVVLIVAHYANLYDHLVVVAGTNGGADVTLSSLNIASLILVGMSLLSLGSVVYDRTKAKDNTNTAAEPRLLGAAGLHPKAVQGVHGHASAS